VKSVEKYGRQGRESVSKVQSVSTNFHDTLSGQPFVANVPNVMKIRDGLVVGIASQMERRVDEVFS